MSMRDLPKSMKAAILVAQNQPLVVAEVRLPEALSCGQVLVKLDFSGICGSQLGEISGAKGPDAYLPHLLGHEASGHVLAIGPGVRKVKSGDRIVAHWMKGVGLEAEPPAYTWEGGRLNAGWITTFNEFAILSENRVTSIPETVDGRIAALLGCAVTTGLGVVTHDAGLHLGESILVLGAGGVGLNIIQGAALSSAHPIIGVDLHDNRLEIARTLGATHVLRGGGTDLKERILALAGASGLDVVVDNTGLPEMIQLAYELAKPQGRVVLVGVPRKGMCASLYTLPLHFGKTLKGSHGGGTNPSEDIPRYLRMVEAGILRLEPLVTHEFPLERINDALDGMRSGAIAGRCMLDLRS